MFGSVMSYAHGYTFDDKGIIVEEPTRQRPVAEDYFLDHGFAAAPMAYDIAAIQYLYGANTTFASGTTSTCLPDSNDPRPFLPGPPNEAGVPRDHRVPARYCVLAEHLGHRGHGRTAL